jgi:hypothetical protein
VPGAGVAQDGTLSLVSKHKKYLYCVKAFSKMFRAKYVALLRKQGIKDKPLFDALFAKKWVVYAKRPFGSTHSVIEYLGRYTHKVAIGNSRILDVSTTDVTFKYKDYKANGTNKVLKRLHAEFTRRFAQHILPHRFVRIRHHGILSGTWKRAKLPALQQSVGVIPSATTIISTKLHCCPTCNTATMVTISVFDKRGPPQFGLLAKQNNPA